MAMTPTQVFRERRKARRKQARLKEWYFQIKESLKCADCGFSHPAAIHFHHFGQKSGDVSRMVRDAYSKTKILAEIAKCIPLCANCHAIRHYNEEYAPQAGQDGPTLTARVEMLHPEFQFGGHSQNMPPSRVQETTFSGLS